MNTLSYFEIQAADVQKAKAFYENVFGWTFVRETFTPIEYYRIETATLFGGLLERPAVTPPPGHGTNAFTCSFQVEDFDATAQIIIDNGGQVAMPKFPVPMRYWQGYFMDTDNNVFGIMEVDKYAGVSRLPGSE